MLNFRLISSVRQQATPITIPIVRQFAIRISRIILKDSAVLHLVVDRDRQESTGDLYGDVCDRRVYRNRVIVE